MWGHLFRSLAITVGLVSLAMARPAEESLLARLNREYGSVEQALNTLRLEVENQAIWQFSANPALYFEALLPELRQWTDAAEAGRWASPLAIQRSRMDLQWATLLVQDRRQAVAAFRGDLQPESAYVRSCAQQLRGQTRVIERTVSDLCLGGFAQVLMHAHPTRYLVSGNADGTLKIQIPVRVRFQSGADAPTRIRLWNRWQQGTQCVSNFWNRYGLRMEIQVQSGDGDHAIELRAGRGRSNARTLYLEDSNYQCGVLIHEFGHYLGLGDEYVEAGYACGFRAAHLDRESPMNNAYQNPSVLRIRPRHFQRILGNVCGSPFEFARGQGP